MKIKNIVVLIESTNEIGKIMKLKHIFNDPQLKQVRDTPRDN